MFRARTSRARLLIVLIVLAILVITAYAGSLLAFGSISRAFAYLRGERLFIMEPQIDFGTLKVHQARSVVARMVNWSNHPVRLLGTNACCEFSYKSGLPAVIAPGKTQEVQFQLQFGKSQPADYRRTIEIFTDDPAVPHVRLSVVGYVAD